MRRTIAVAALAVLLTGGPCRAGFTLTFGQPAYTGQAGTVIPVTVFLTWDGNGTNGLSTVGLNDAGVGLRASTGNPALVGSATVTPGPAFAGANNTYTAYTPSSGSPFTGPNRVAGLAESRFFDPPVTTAGSSILLGTFQLTGAGPGTLTLQADRLDVTGNGTFTDLGDGTILDQPSTFPATYATPGSATLTFTPSLSVTAAPAPPGVVLLGTGMAPLLFAALRRHRRAGRP